MRNNAEVSTFSTCGTLSKMRDSSKHENPVSRGRVFFVDCETV